MAAERSKKVPPLLEVLLSLKASSIYAMGSPREIAAAAAAFSAGVVESFRWGNSGMLLEACLSSGNRHAILFTSAEGKLITSGQPDSVHTRCNVLAAIMTILRTLHGSKFHRSDLPAGAIERFRAQLRAPTTEEAGACVTLAPGAPGKGFEFDYDSGRRESSWRVTRPPQGMEWLDWQDKAPEKVAATFCRWVEKMPDDIEIVIRIEGREIRLKNTDTAQMNARVHLGWDGGSVVIRRALLDESGHLHEPFLDLGYDLAFLPEEKIFAQILPAGAWAGSGFSQLSPGSTDPTRIPANDFLVPFSGTMADACALTAADGSPVAPVPTGCRPRLDAVTDGARVQISFGVESDSGRTIPGHAAVAGWFAELFLDGPFTLLVATAGRRRKLAQLLARTVLLREPAAVDEILREAESDPAFSSPAMHGRDAEKCLRHLLARWQALDGPHLAVDSDQPDRPWMLCTGTGEAVGRSFAAFARAFPGEDPLRAKERGLECDALRFFEFLPALAPICEELGVELRVDDRLTKVERLKLSMRVIRDGDIDWFELHPKACAGALTIPQSQWEQILRTGHFRQEDDTLTAFDAASLQALKRLAALAGAEAGRLRIPRLRIFDWLALRNEGVDCELPAEDAAVLDSLQGLEGIPRRPLPSGLSGILRDYQHHGYDWLCFLYSHRFGACLADDMGLGKTLQAIALLAALKEGLLERQGSIRPHLIVLPPTLLFNWQNEIRRFAPALAVHEYTGQERSADFGGADIVMTTYELVRRDIEILDRIPFDVAVFDEAQAVKNALAARTQAAARLEARFRLCLTGTPMENHVGEFHSIMEIALPGIFGDRKAFLRDYESGRPVLDRVRPFLLRRTKAKILSELPPKIESDSYFSLSEPQRECYTRAVGEVRAEVMAAFRDRPSQQAGMVALAALLRLRQICISPALMSPEFDAGSPKIEALVEQLAELAEEGHAALVFSQFLKALDLTGAALDAAGLPFLRLDGSTPAPRRKALVESFQSGDSPGIFLISLKTGGTGLNLTRASYVYHLDPWWNPAVENQASDRVHRIGQKSSVFVQRLLMRHTIEEKMMSLKQQKQALFTAIVENRDAASLEGSAALTADDFRFLIEGNDVCPLDAN